MDNPQQHLPLTPAVFHILLTLTDGELHGYGIMQRVKDISEGVFTLGPGTLYRTIQQMVEQGLIVECDSKVDSTLNDERRRYYRLTEFGQRVLKAEAQRLAVLVRLAGDRRLLEG